ncbi:hypothetical protein ACFS7Z_07545 [Pontibacter toksunensis]|uniref:Uncharacterized protein n=1 Tax=Pontibacter toksunensis TaxID=1332631 RepID=A0ABW6BQV7_9BACT
MKKSLTLEKQVLSPEENHTPYSINGTVLLSAVLFAFTIVHILIAIVLSFLNADLYITYTAEDGYIEYMTAAFLLATSVLCFNRASAVTGKLPKVFFYATATLFFLGFGEEISWGQRIIGFATPEDLRAINFQEEFTFHNIRKDGIDVNKLLFGKVLYTCVFIYYLGFNMLYRHVNRFRNLVETFMFPVPTATQSVIYFLAFSSVWIIREGEKWEMQEFVLSSILFITFLFPANKRSEIKR